MLGKAKTVHGFGLTTTDEAPDALADFFINACVAGKVLTDGVGEFTGEEWKKQLRELHTTKDVIEADYQIQNFVERVIETVKNLFTR